ncbi:hypothetical protein X801_01421 [Opisthorchis viverrini]|uniref:Uncharacterized protein n=1 Tax=Opisthorchis viverrini TaxID=6198 RepID=A0A1S8X7M2_OPIVI|nr:hypothetical protein X801_01421 [Opisthorchis viverrini]
MSVIVVDGFYNQVTTRNYNSDTLSLSCIMIDLNVSLPLSSGANEKDSVYLCACALVALPRGLWCCRRAGLRQTPASGLSSNGERFYERNITINSKRGAHWLTMGDAMVVVSWFAAGSASYHFVADYNWGVPSASPSDMEHIVGRGQAVRMKIPSGPDQSTT